MCTVTVSLRNDIPDIASFRAMEEGDNALLKLADAQVLYVYGDEVYVRDTTGSLILNGAGLDVKRNDVLNGSIFGHLTYSNLMPQLVPLDGSTPADDISVSSGDAAVPTVLYGEELTADHYADLVLVKGLTLVRDGGIFAVIGDRRVRLWNKFQIKSPKISLPSNLLNKYYDVTAIYGTDVVNGNLIEELYVLSSPVEGTAPDAVRAPQSQELSPEYTYNMQGQRVAENFKGIVIRGGRKYLQK